MFLLPEPGLYFLRVAFQSVESNELTIDAEGPPPGLASAWAATSTPEMGLLSACARLESEAAVQEAADVAERLGDTPWALPLIRQLPSALIARRSQWTNIDRDLYRRLVLKPATP